MAKSKGWEEHLSCGHNVVWKTSDRDSSSTLTLGLAYQQLLQLRSTLLSFLGNVCLPSCFPEYCSWLRGKVISSVLMSTVPALPRCPGEGGCPVLHSSQTLTCPQAAAQARDICLDIGGNNPCCWRAMDPDIAPGVSIGQDPTMVPGSITVCSCQTVPW